MRALILLLLTALVSVLSSPAQEKDSSLVGVVAAFEGTVFVEPPGGERVPMQKRMRIVAGSVVSANADPPNAWVEIAVPSERSRTGWVIEELFDLTGEGVRLEVRESGPMVSDLADRFAKTVSGDLQLSGGAAEAQGLVDGHPAEGAVPLLPGGFEAFFASSVRHGLRLVIGGGRPGLTADGARRYPLDAAAGRLLAADTVLYRRRDADGGETFTRTAAMPLSPAEDGGFVLELDGDVIESLPESRYLLVLNLQSASGELTRRYLAMEIRSDAYLEWLTRVQLPRLADARGLSEPERTYLLASMLHDDSMFYEAWRLLPTDP